MSGITQLFTNIFNLGPPASFGQVQLLVALTGRVRGDDDDDDEDWEDGDNSRDLWVGEGRDAINFELVRAGGVSGAEEWASAESVTNSFLLLQRAEHAFTDSFSFMIEHVFTLGQACLLHMFTIFLHYVLHTLCFTLFTSRPTHLLTYLNQ